MPGMGGMEVLKKIASLQVPVEVIILTAHATVSTAVEAMKLGRIRFFNQAVQDRGTEGGHRQGL